MKGLDNFGYNITPRMPVRGIRKRGAVSGVPFPAEDLDAYIKELVTRSSAEVGANTYHTFADLGATDPGADPVATNWGGSGPLILSVTAAGQVKRVWLSRVSSNGASGVTNCFKVTSVKNGDSDAFVFFSTDSGTANNIRFSSDSGATVSAASSRNWQSVTYDSWSGQYLVSPKVSDVVRVFSSYAGLVANTPTTSAAGVNFTEADSFIEDTPYMSRWISSSQINIYLVAGSSAVTESMTIASGTLASQQPFYLNGRVVAKGIRGGVIGFFLHRPGLGAEFVAPEGFSPSFGTQAIRVGSVVFDRDTETDWLWYSRDLVTWHPHTPNDESNTRYKAVGARLFTDTHFTGPCI